MRLALRRWAMVWRLGLLLCGAGLLGACAMLPREEATPLAGTQPQVVHYRPGQLALLYPDGGRGTWLVARWAEGGEDAQATVFHTALLERAEAPPPGATEADAGVRLLDADAWAHSLEGLLASLLPDEPAAGALVTVQGRDIVVYRRTDGSLATALHEHKPADVRVARSWSEPAFTAHAIEQLGQRYGPHARLLFDTGPADGSLVLFDLARNASVWVLHETGAGQPAGESVAFALRLSDAVLLRSHVLSPLLRPVSTVGRLAWLTTQSAATALPRPAGDAAPPPPPAGDAAPLDLVAWEQRLDQLTGAQALPGAIEPLIDGEAYFAALVQAIQEARESVDIRVYIFDRDDVALRLAELLRRRSTEIRVRVLVDGLGTLVAGRAGGAEARGSIVDILRQGSNVQVRVAANPWFTSDHTKVIVADGRQAFVGGMNIGREYRYDWHDLMIGLRGPVVARLAHDFERAWAYAGPGGELAWWLAGLKQPAAMPTPADAVMLRPLYTHTADPQILRAQLEAMQRARRRIWVQHAYLSDDAVLAGLIDARRRGVDVRVILPSRGDSGFMNSANQVAANALLRNGVRVYAFPGMTHVKAALYDGWAIVGSANFDKLSLRINQETNIATADPGFVGQLEQALFLTDFRRASELREPRSIGLPGYLAAFLANQL